MKPLQLKGKRFGRLLVIERAGSLKGRAAWRCECDCGKTHVAISERLSSGHTTSCGCYKIDVHTLPEGEATFRSERENYKHSAKRRRLAWELTDSQFRFLLQSKCFYCGLEPSRTLIARRRKRNTGSLVCNGVDRKDNNLGYTIENCVSCCWLCNRFKGADTTEAFVSHCKRVYEFQCHLG